MKLTKKRTKELFEAIESGNKENVDEFLGTWPDKVDIAGEHNTYCRDKSPLIYSIQCEQFELASIFIDSGANVNFRVADCNTTPLSMAIHIHFFMDMGVFEKLLQKGADPNQGDLLFKVFTNSATSIFRKKGFDFIKQLQLLLDHGADPDQEFFGHGKSIREFCDSYEGEVPDEICDMLNISPKGFGPAKPIKEESEFDLLIKYPCRQFRYKGAIEALAAGLTELEKKKFLNRNAFITIEGRRNDEKWKEEKLSYSNGILAIDFDRVSEDIASEWSCFEKSTCGHLTFTEGTSATIKAAFVIELLFGDQLTDSKNQRENFVKIELEKK